MIIDSTLTFADALAVDAGIGTANVGDIIDLDTIGRRIGGSQNISLYIGVTAAFTSGTSSTISFKLVSDSTASPATAGAETLHFQSEAFADAALVVGAKLHVRLPGGLPNAERYLGLQVVTGSAATTAGSISAALVLDAQDWAALPDAVN